MLQQQGVPHTPHPALLADLAQCLKPRLSWLTPGQLASLLHCLVRLCDVCVSCVQDLRMLLGIVLYWGARACVSGLYPHQSQAHTFQ